MKKRSLFKRMKPVNEGRYQRAQQFVYRDYIWFRVSPGYGGMNQDEVASSCWRRPSLSELVLLEPKQRHRFSIEEKRSRGSGEHSDLQTSVSRGNRDSLNSAASRL